MINCSNIAINRLRYFISKSSTIGLLAFFIGKLRLKGAVADREVFQAVAQIVLYIIKHGHILGFNHQMGGNGVLGSA
jgi:hypothetical protein